MYKTILRPLLFSLDAETIHHAVFNALHWAGYLPFSHRFTKLMFTTDEHRSSISLFGLTFANPVGLAAGFDKDAKYLHELSAFGFGHIEIGTLTPKPQPGNPKPRLFRLPDDQALINRMGFNNEGVEAAVRRLDAYRSKKDSTMIIGGNIGKNKATPNEDAIRDYEICFDALFDYVDYITLNVSSPNTPNLRALQDKEPLKKLLFALQEKNQQKKKPKPLLLKIAPDLSQAQLDDVIEITHEAKLSAIIATNTTISREGLKTSLATIEKIGAGGLSGKPLASKATEVVAYLSRQTAGKLPIIGVGGIHSAADALAKKQAGASLVQIYTGFVYEGPWLIEEINQSWNKS
ncbi:MAG: quinone-dependent dihydroorotate dehydrogenase [Flammeovirgaceae bacterium]|nr:quinone-dependent dihydroorotate dehydrogenase [Flammeovirgaceae bacterium]MDW8287378.1 quinone-dependent dihydroorotate dehydrogenase [Flammeovirgaceae bacterium]